MMASSTHSETIHTANYFREHPCTNLELSNPKDYPSKLSIYANAHALARYSALVQENGMVPIVEPEVLMDGEHSAEECFNKTSEVIKKCYEELIKHKVDLKGTILKPNMILSGSSSKKNIDSKKIAELTLKCLKLLCKINQTSYALFRKEEKKLLLKEV